MSTCPSPAALKQVVRKEPHIRANRFRPNSGRGLISSIVTGKNYARSREQGDDNQGTHPTGNAVLCVRLLHDDTVLREVLAKVARIVLAGTRVNRGPGSGRVVGKPYLTRLGKSCPSSANNLGFSASLLGTIAESENSFRAFSLTI